MESLPNGSGGSTTVLRKHYFFLVLDLSQSVNAISQRKHNLDSQTDGRVNDKVKGDKIELRSCEVLYLE